MKYFFLLFIIISQTLSAQSPDYLKGAPFITNFSFKEFKGEPQVWSSVQDKNGLMYFANSAGVLVYDGSRWLKITGGFNGVVRSLAYDSVSNKIFVGARHTFGFLEENKNGIKQFRAVRKPDKIKDLRLGLIDHVQMLNGSAYFFTPKTLIRVKDTTATAWTFSGKVSPLHNTNIHQILFQVAGEGLYEVTDDNPRLLMPNMSLQQHYSNFSDSVGINHYLIFESHGQFLSFQNNVISPLKLNLPKLSESPSFYRGAKINDSTYALATLNKGILFITKNGNLTDWLTEENGLINNNVKHLTVDKDGNIWASTEKGISFIEYRTPIRNISKQFKLDAIVESSFFYENKLYIGTGSGAFLVQKSLGENPFIPELKPITELRAQIFSIVRVGKFLLAGTGDGFYQLEPFYRKIHGDPYRSAFLYPVPGNSDFVLAGLIDGIAVLKYDGSNWNVLGRLGDIRSETWTIAKDTSGYIWAGSKAEGVFRFKFNAASPLKPEGTVNFNNSNSNLTENEIYVHRINDDLVLATHNSITTPGDSGKFVPYHKLGSEFASGNHWLEKIRPNKKNQLIYIYGTQSNPEYNSVFETADSKDLTKPSVSDFKRLSNTLIYHLDVSHSDIYWFGGPDGLFRYNVYSNPEPQKPNQSSLRAVTINSDSVILSGSLFRKTFPHPITLQSPVSQIRFEFTTLNFVAPDYNLYQYYLENYEDDWSDLSTEVQKDYTNIPSGSYRFMVRSKTKDGRYSEPDYIDVIVLPPWYQSAWMIVFYAVLGLGLLYLIVKWRTRLLLEKNRQLELTVRDKTQQLLQSEKMAAFGQITSGLSHELNNPLTVVSMNLESLRLSMDSMSFTDEQTKDNFTKSINDSFYGIDRMANIIQSMKLLAFSHNRITALTDINAEINDVLRLYFSNLSNIAFSKKLSSVPQIMLNTGDLRRAFVNLLLNSIQAIQESYKRKTLPESNGKISIETSVRQSPEGKVIIIIITDNGIGFPDHIAEKVFDPFFTTKEIGAGKGLGLSETYSLIQSMHGEIKINSSENQGTIVQILLPVTAAAT